MDEISKEKMAGNVVVNKVELVDISDQPLSDSLFEVPVDYKPAPVPLNGLPPLSSTSSPK